MTDTSISSIFCRKGDACAFVVTVQGGIDAAYTKAKFQVRTRFDDTLPLLLGASEADGITIDHVAGTIAVTMGALKTGTLPVVQPTPVAAQLRLTSGVDPNDAVSWIIPFTILPELIA